MLSYPPEVVEALIASQDTFVWETEEYPTYPRGPRWYGAMTLIALAFIVYAVWTANFLFAFIILLMGILLLLVSRERPRRVIMQVGENGVVWNGALYLFQDLGEFSIIYQPPWSKVLYLEHKQGWRPRLRINLEDQDPVVLRNHLKNYLTENLELRDEHLSDIVARLLKI